MREASEAAERIAERQTTQRAALAEGAERMDRMRERMRKKSEALKKPRARHLDKGRTLAALREMSKDLDSLERDLDGMRKRDAEVSDLLDDRRDALLRACFELKRTADAGRLYRDVERARTFDEPVGGRTFESSLPDWVPGRRGAPRK